MRDRASKKGVEKMKASKSIALLWALLVAVTTLFPPNALADQKRRIAIMPFEYGSVSGVVGTHDVGKGIVSMLTTKLVNDGTYEVVDRQMLDSVLKEQNFAASDRADSATAIKVGKLLSIDAMIVGTVTEFGFENQSSHVNAGAGIAYIPYVGGFGGLGGLGVHTHKGKVKVSVDAKLVDVTTGTTLAACSGSGVSQRGGTSLWGGGGGGFGDVGSGAHDFETSIAGEAISAAVNDIATQLEAAASKIDDRKSVANANVEGKVADVTGKVVTVNLGKTNGLAVGDNLQVQRSIKTIKDPDTGKVLKEVSNTVAVVTLNQVEDSSSSGDIVKGSGVRVGDQVKKVTTDVSGIILSAPDPSASMSATGAILPKKPIVKTVTKSAK